MARAIAVKTIEALDKYIEIASRCVRCGACTAVCPTYISERRETFSPRGRLALIKAFIDGRLPATRTLWDRISSCVGCLACETACPAGVQVSEILQAAKEEVSASQLLIERIAAEIFARRIAPSSLGRLAPRLLGYRPEPLHKQIWGRGPVASASADAQPGRGIVGRPRGRLVFFPGCGPDLFQQDIARSSLAVLARLGYEVIIPEGLTCCGRPLLSLGHRAAAEALAAKNAAVISAMDPDAVVTACASCGLTFKKDYHRLLRRMGMPAVMDIHEVLARDFSSSVLPVRLKVTLHDPCHLARGQALGREMRNILLSVPELELIEMHDPGMCCGFGGAARLTHRRLSSAIGRRKAKDIISTGASLVVTGCPGCCIQITDSLRRLGSSIEVVHTVQIVEHALIGEPEAAQQSISTF